MHKEQFNTGITESNLDTLDAYSFLSHRCKRAVAATYLVSAALEEPESDYDLESFPGWGPIQFNLRLPADKADVLRDRAYERDMQAGGYARIVLVDALRLVSLQYPSINEIVAIRRAHEASI